MYIFSLTIILAVISIIVLARNVEDFSIAKTLCDTFNGIVIGVGSWVVFAIMIYISQNLAYNAITVEDIVSFAIAISEVFLLFFVSDKVNNVHKRYSYKQKAWRLGLALLAVAFVDIVSIVGYCIYTM